MRDDGGGGGDPPELGTQSLADRRQLRAGYRTLINDATDKRDELVRPDGKVLGKGLMQALDAADALHEKVEKAREQAIDTSLMVVLGDIGLQLAKSLTPGQQKTTPGQLLGHLRARYAPAFAVADDTSQPLPPSAFDWRALGAAVSKFFRTAHSSGPHMLGPISVEPKVRKVTQRRAKDPVAPMVRPDEVEDAAAGQQSMVAENARNLKVMRKVLQQLGVVDALELVYNGESFAQTVENIFTLSFMVHGGLVKLTPAAGGTAVHAELTERPTDADFAARTAEASQFMLRFNYQDWQAAREHMPREPRIPNREDINEQQKQYASQAAAVDEEEGGEAAPVERGASKRKAKAPKQRGKSAALREEEEDAEADGGDDDEDEVMPVAKKRRAQE